MTAEQWLEQLRTGLPEDPPEFTQAMKLAQAAATRDEKVEHYRKALLLRPNDPRNIQIEFQIGIELTQRSGPNGADIRRPEEGHTVFEGILKQYDHKLYYTRGGMDTSNSPEVMIPWTRILAGGAENIELALSELNWTFQKRKADWLAEPAPVAPTSAALFFMRPGEFEARTAWWEKQQANARAGNVLTTLEKSIVQTAVRRYGARNGSRSEDVGTALGELIDIYPETPIADAAREEQVKVSIAAAAAPAQLSPRRAVARPAPPPVLAQAPTSAVAVPIARGPVPWRLWFSVFAVLLFVVAAVAVIAATRRRKS